MAKKTKPNVLAEGVMDVSKPGKTPPATNSKHVIVNSRQIIKDPMVKEDEVATQTPARPAPSRSVKINVEPLSAPAPESKSELKIIKATPDEAEVEKLEANPAPTPPEPEKQAESVPIMPPVAPEPEPEPGEDRPKHDNDEILVPPTSDTPPDEPSAETTADEEPKTSKGEAKLIEDKVDEELDKKLQKLVDSKKYFLPINSVEKRRSKRVVIGGVLLSLLLIVAWVDVALDAGLVELNGLKPVTHFFSN